MNRRYLPAVLALCATLLAAVTVRVAELLTLPLAPVHVRVYVSVPTALGVTV